MEFPWGLFNFPLLTSIPLGIGIPLGFITPTEKSRFGRFWLGVINPMGIGIPLGFITPTEKTSFGRFWLDVINPMGIGISLEINQSFTFDFNSLGNRNSPGIHYTNWKIEFWSILTWCNKSHGNWNFPAN